MAAIYSNGGNRWNILGFNFTKRDALSSVYKISMVTTIWKHGLINQTFTEKLYEWMLLIESRAGGVDIGAQDMEAGGYRPMRQCLVR
jgi:hypothetical protein